MSTDGYRSKPKNMKTTIACKWEVSTTEQKHIQGSHPPDTVEELIEELISFTIGSYP